MRCSDGEALVARPLSLESHDEANILRYSAGTSSPYSRSSFVTECALSYVFLIVIDLLGRLEFKQVSFEQDHAAMLLLTSTGIHMVVSEFYSG